MPDTAFATTTDGERQLGTLVHVRLIGPAGRSLSASEIESRFALSDLQQAAKEFGAEQHGVTDACISLRFREPSLAAKWCLTTQPTLLAPSASSDTDAYRSTMVVHVYGAPDDEVSQEATDTCQRLSDLGQAGQVLLTEQAWRKLSATRGVLGHAHMERVHRFEDAGTGGRVFQLIRPDLNRSAAGSNDGAVRRHNLPSDATLFIGRESLFAEIDARWQRDARIVVLKGPGGVGKTRLALRYAGRSVPDYVQDGGVWLCGLSDARSMEGICHAVARALNIPLRAKSMGAAQQIGQALASRGKCLLVLDNFEQIVKFAEYTIGLWSRKAPELRILVTSRHRLGLEEEHVVEVPSLTTVEAEELFRAKARVLRPEMKIRPGDPDLLRLLRAVRCVPLAVELASAWVPILTLRAIADRVLQGIDALNGVTADVESRHTTLRAIMEESWNLLTPFEQDALMTCSTFRGGFTADALESVLDLSQYRNAPPPFIVVQSLRDKSLVYTDDSQQVGTHIRWHLYPVAQVFAEERLATSGMRPTIEGRHARFYVQFAKYYAERIRTMSAVRALEALEADEENLIAVYDRYIDRKPHIALWAVLSLDPVLSAHGPFDIHLELLDGCLKAAAAMKPDTQIPVLIANAEAMLQRGRFVDAARFSAEALKASEDSEDPALRAHALAIDGWCRSQLGFRSAGHQSMTSANLFFKHNPTHPHTMVLSQRIGLSALRGGDIEEAEQAFNAVLSSSDADGNPWSRMDALSALGDLARHQGRPDAGQKRYEKALRIADKLGDRPRQARLLTRLGSVAMDKRKTREAARLFASARGHALASGDQLETARIDGNIARMRHHEGKGTEAESLYRDVIEVFVDTGASRFEGIYRGILAALFHEQGRLDEAEASYEDGVRVLEECGDRRFAGLVMGRLGALRADRGSVKDAQGLIQRASEYLNNAGDPLGLAALNVHIGHLDLVRARNGDAAGVEGAKARIDSASTKVKVAKGHPPLSQPPAAISADVRLAMRLLRNSIRLV